MRWAVGDGHRGICPVTDIEVESAGAGDPKQGIEVRVEGRQIVVNGTFTGWETQTFTEEFTIP